MCVWQADDWLPDNRGLARLLAKFWCTCAPYTHAGSLCAWHVRTCHSLDEDRCNNHTICDEELRPIGIGIFPMAAMVNHSCDPSCAQGFVGQEICFRAVRPLEPGDEVTISYLDPLPRCMDSVGCGGR